MLEYTTSSTNQPVSLRIAALRAARLEEGEYQKRVIRARNYHDGLQATKLTERLKEFLNSSQDDTFRLNICRTVVSALTEKLSIEDWIDYGTTRRTLGGFADWCWRQWTDGGLGVLSDEVNGMAVRDGESFLFVDYDPKEKRIWWLPHPRYTAPEVGGDGFGCRAVYQQDDPNQRLLYVSKYWTDIDARNNRVARRNDYFPERIDKKRLARGGVWETFETVPWVDALGLPLGIPIIHFRNTEDAPEALDAWVIQDGINKSMIDALNVLDLFGFPTPVAIGFTPTTDGKSPNDDGSNVITLEPGRWVGTTKTDARVEFLQADKVMQAFEAIDKQIAYCATVTDTPLSRFFVFTAQVQSAESQQEQDEPLNIKVEKRQARFGRGWMDAMRVARAQAVAFGGEVIDLASVAYPVWKAARRVDPMKKYTEGEAQQRLGLPQEWIWSNTLGLTAEQINAIKATDEYKTKQEIARAQLNPLGA